jgi:wobble nucleotide-excising tRNase
MRSVKVEKNELLGIVRENKKKHIKEFDESVKDYKKAAVKVAKEHVELAKTGDLDKISKIRAMPQRPNSYEKDYDRAIRMLELSVEDTIELEEDVFNQLVLDEWTWKNSFVATGALYKTL